MMDSDRDVFFNKPVFNFNTPGQDWIDSIDKITVESIEVSYLDEYVVGLAEAEEELSAMEEFFYSLSSRAF